jgi:hypothetical protein
MRLKRLSPLLESLHFRDSSERLWMMMAEHFFQERINLLHGRTQSMEFSADLLAAAREDRPAFRTLSGIHM